MAENLIIDGAALQQLLTGEQGPVVQELEYLGSAVQMGARAMIRPSQVRGAGGGLSLRDSIVKRLIPGAEPSMLVVGNKPYAYYLHEGTAAHDIRPRQKKALRFYSQSAGGFVFAKVVHHPGTKPLPYLTQPLAEALNHMREFAI